MTDHVLTLNLTEKTLAQLEAAARAVGVTPHDYAVAILERALAVDPRNSGSHDFTVRESDTAFVADETSAPWPPTKPYDTTEAERRLAEYDRTGDYVTLDDAMERFERTLKAKLVARR